MTTNTMEARVDAGMDFLDMIRPGWEKEINLAVLRLSSCRLCILGQLFDDFDDALFYLEMSEDAATDWGFYLSDTREIINEDYPELTEIWRRKISERLGARVATAN